MLKIVRIKNSYSSRTMTINSH